MRNDVFTSIHSVVCLFVNNFVQELCHMNYTTKTVVGLLCVKRPKWCHQPVMSFVFLFTFYIDHWGWIFNTSDSSDFYIDNQVRTLIWLPSVYMIIYICKWSSTLNVICLVCSIKDIFIYCIALCSVGEEAVLLYS